MFHVVKNILYLLTAILVLNFSSTYCNSQNVIELFKINTEMYTKDTVAVITSFKGKRNGVRTYLEWTIKNLKENGVFVIYSSNNGESYTSIGTKVGVGVNTIKNIAYYFIDDSEKQQSHYKFMFISNNKKYFTSEVLITNTNLLTTN